MFERGGRGLGGAKVDLESVGVAGECGVGCQDWRAWFSKIIALIVC